MSNKPFFSFSPSQISLRIFSVANNSPKESVKRRLGKKFPASTYFFKTCNERLFARKLLHKVEPGKLTFLSDGPRFLHNKRIAH